VLTKHWPKVWRHGDIKTLTGDMIRENCGQPDLLCGGFPCVDISNAGGRIGIDGPASGLWSEFFKIICEIRPDRILVENVAALLQRGICRVLGDMAECGYDAEWRCYRASQFGAPHIRDRLFILGTRRNSNSTMSDCGSVLADAGDESRWIQQSYRSSDSSELLENGFNVVPRRQEDIYNEGAIHTGIGHWKSEPGIGRVVHGVSNWMDRRSRLGNSVVPQIAEFIGHRIMESYSQTERPT
jgi:DNA (cytosine-5)-methyltransferase 1